MVCVEGLTLLDWRVAPAERVKAEATARSGVYRIVAVSIDGIGTYRDLYVETEGEARLLSRHRHIEDAMIAAEAREQTGGAEP